MSLRFSAITALRFVALLYFVSGCLALADLLARPRQERVLLFNLGLAGIPIAIGLLNYRLFWRTVALVIDWLLMICLMLFVSLLCLLPADNVFAFWDGERVRVTFEVRMVTMGLLLLVWLLVYWQYRLLVRTDVCELFGLRTPSSNVSIPSYPKT